MLSHHTKTKTSFRRRIFFPIIQSVLCCHLHPSKSPTCPFRLMPSHIAHLAGDINRAIPICWASQGLTSPLSASSQDDEVRLPEDIIVSGESASSFCGWEELSDRLRLNSIPPMIGRLNLVPVSVVGHLQQYIILTKALRISLLVNVQMIGFVAELRTASTKKYSALKRIGQVLTSHFTSSKRRMNKGDQQAMKTLKTIITVFSRARDFSELLLALATFFRKVNLRLLVLTKMQILQYSTTIASKRAVKTVVQKRM